MKRKLLFTFALALLTATGTWVLTAFTVDNPNNLKYTVTDESANTVELTGYETRPEGTLNIPASVNYKGSTYSVTSIGERAFSDCYALTQITIPNSVTNIGESAFAGCDALTQVTIPNSVTNIGESAFAGCDALTAINVEGSNTTYCSENGILFNKDKTTLVCYPAGRPETTYTIPGSVTSIADEAFFGCSALTQVNIPGSVTSIGDEAFYGTALYNNADNWTNNVLYIDNCLISANEGLSGNYEIAASTRLIADQAFWGSEFTQVTIPGNVTSIGSSAFFGCSSLTQVNIPGSVTSIGEAAFWNCLALTAIHVDAANTAFCSENGVLFNKNKTTLVQYPAKPETTYTIPNCVTSIGEGAFANCDALTQVTIPNCVTSIGDRAFSGCSKLTQVTIPNSVTSIGESAFANCDALTQVTIPNSVTSIGSGAFSDCSKLTQVNIPDGVTSIGVSAFSGCSALTQVNIPDGVTSIGNGAFAQCYALTQVTIGSSVTSIEDYAFWNCSALAEMTVLATVPPTVGTDVFYNVSRDIPVYVPAEALEDYQVAETWKEFNLQAMQTGLQTPTMPESISVYGGLLHNPQGLPVSIYDMQGRMVYSGTATTVSQPAGVYVVLCAGASRKVLF